MVDYRVVGKDVRDVVAGADSTHDDREVVALIHEVEADY